MPANLRVQQNNYLLRLPTATFGFVMPLPCNRAGWIVCLNAGRSALRRTASASEPDMMRIAATLAAAVLAAAAAALPATFGQSVSEPLPVREVAPGVFVHFGAAAL